MFNFEKKTIGLDIADRTIEVAELTRNSGIKVTSLGRINLLPGIVERGRIMDEEKLLIAVKTLLAGSRPKAITSKEIYFGLPESQSYTHFFRISRKNDNGSERNEKHINKLVLEEARTIIPLEKDDLLFSYKILNKTQDNFEILLVATSRQVILEWNNFFKKAGLKVEAFDIETLATFRGLFNNSSPGSVCVLDIGAESSSISIFNKTGIRYSRLLNIGGDLFTDKIAKSFKIDNSKAEEKKIKEGLGSGNDKILLPFLDEIAEELKEAFSYLEEDNSAVEKMVLVGGSAIMIGLKEYFENKVGLPVAIGESGAFKDRAPLVYIEAIGLALRGVDSRWEKKDPIIILGEDREMDMETRSEKSIGLSGESSAEVSKEDEEAKRKRLKKQKIILIIIVFIGVSSFLVAKIYSDRAKAKKDAEIQRQLNQYAEKQKFDFKIPVAIKKIEYTADRVRGRIIEDLAIAGKSSKQAIDDSRAIIKNSLDSGETLWDEPLNFLELSANNALATDQIIRWLVYSERDANSLFLKKINDINIENVNYILDEIKKVGIELSDNDSIIYLNGEVFVSLDKLIVSIPVDINQSDVAVGTTTAESIIGEDAVLTDTSFNTGDEFLKIIVINDTETGWLNIRNGAGASYPILAKVYPGEEYGVIEERSGWQKIRLSDGRGGWLSAKYTQEK